MYASITCGIGGDLGVGSLGEHRAAREHRDRVADARDHAHVVLDHQHGAPHGDFLDQVLHAVHVLVPHARGGLVEQHQFGLHRERGGDLQRALAAVGELARVDARELAEAHGVEQRHRAVVQHVERLLALPEVERGAELALQADAHVLQHREVAGYTAEIWNERIMPRRATSAGLSRVMSCPLKRIVPAVGGRNLVSRLKQVVLPAPLGPISAWMRAAPDPEVDVVDRDKALELLGQAVGFENEIVSHPVFRSRVLASPTRASAFQ